MHIPTGHQREYRARSRKLARAADPVKGRPSDCEHCGRHADLHHCPGHDFTAVRVCGHGTPDDHAAFCVPQHYKAATIRVDLSINCALNITSVSRSKLEYLGFDFQIHTDTYAAGRTYSVTVSIRAGFAAGQCSYHLTVPGRCPPKVLY